MLFFGLFAQFSVDAGQLCQEFLQEDSREILGITGYFWYD